MSASSIILITAGLIYLIKPDLYKRGFSRKNSANGQVEISKNYILYMRILGIIFIGIGIYLAWRG